MAAVNVSVKDAIGLVELNEPEARNPLSVAIMDGVSSALTTLVADGVRAVIITGAGPAFSAGGDLKSMPVDEAGGHRFITGIFEWFEAVERCPVPTIAALNGAAVGGGAELAMACDLVVAVEDAVFGFPETRLGLIAPYACARLAGLVPRAIAKELTLTGRLLRAAEAAQLGLINRVVRRDHLLDTAYALAGEIVARSDAAARVTKALIDSPVPVTAEVAADANAALFADDDTKRRIQEFNDRRSTH